MERDNANQGATKDRFGPGDLFDLEQDNAPSTGGARADADRPMGAASTPPRWLPAHRFHVASAAAVLALAAATAWMVLVPGPSRTPSSGAPPSGGGQTRQQGPAGAHSYAAATAEPAAPAPPEAPPRAAGDQRSPHDPGAAALVAALEDISRRLAAVEARTGGTAGAAAAYAAHAGRAQPRAAPKARHPDKPDGAASPQLGAYKLNTIYEGLAWVEFAGQTYAVQVGDRVGAVSVLSIDARGRRVTTTAGQIR